MKTWNEIWMEKGRRALAEPGRDLASLIRADGFDGGAGRMSEEMFERLARRVRRDLGLRTGMSVLEVGCGAGALLRALGGSGLSLTGVDASETLVDVAREAVDAELFVAEASALPFPDRRFDAAVCHSVFQYFTDLEYAERALRELDRVSRRGWLVLDVPDAALRDAAEVARRLAGSKPGPAHLYYTPAFFTSRFPGVRVFVRELPGYSNAAFRFHVIRSR